MNNHLILLIREHDIVASCNDDLCTATAGHDGTFHGIREKCSFLSKMFTYDTIQTIFDVEGE